MSEGFPHHRQAALALLNGEPGLTHRVAGFCGHCAVASELTAAQGRWLRALLKKHGLPPLAEGGAP